MTCDQVDIFDILRMRTGWFWIRKRVLILRLVCLQPCATPWVNVLDMKVRPRLTTMSVTYFVKVRVCGWLTAKWFILASRGQLTQTTPTFGVRPNKRFCRSSQPARTATMDVQFKRSINTVCVGVSQVNSGPPLVPPKYFSVWFPRCGIKKSMPQTPFFRCEVNRDATVQYNSLPT